MLIVSHERTTWANNPTSTTNTTLNPKEQHPLMPKLYSGIKMQGRTKRLDSITDMVKTVNVQRSDTVNCSRRSSSISNALNLRVPDVFMLVATTALLESTCVTEAAAADAHHLVTSFTARHHHVTIWTRATM